MSNSGWCTSHSHDKCVQRWQRFYIGPVGRGRKRSEGLIWLDEYVECDCMCHTPEEERPKPKRTAKKTTARKTTRRKK